MTTLAQWLNAIGLGQYVTQFIDNKIDLDVVRDLSDADLKDLGLALGDRKRFLQAVAALGNAGVTQSPSTPAPVTSTSERERRQLTIMFCDLVGSTALSATLDPEALSQLMQVYRKVAGDAVSRYEGHVAQYLGDGLMIYFGWPKAHEDDAVRAVRSALDIQSALRWAQAARPLHARIGIATGTVVVGQGEDDQHGEGELAMGETPNLAARLQGEADADEIVIAPSTMRLIGAAFECEDMGARVLKGVLQPVHAFKVLRASQVEGRFEANRGRQLTPLIGRESELALLLDRWHRATSGEGQVVLLSAEAGIGKSRITRALRERIVEAPHAILSYQCSSYHSNSAFHPIIDQFERAARFEAEDTPAAKLKKMETLLATAQVDLARCAPYYAELLALPTTGYPDQHLSPQQRKETTIAALVEQVVGLAAQRPLLMILEDAHWADPTTLESFAAMIERIDHLRLLLLITFRPEFAAPWKAKSKMTALSLARMSMRETSALVERVSGKPLPDEVLEQILTKTDGVPLFAEELTKAVMESEWLHDEGDRYTLSGPLPPLAIPATLRESLMARLDRMSAVKELIQFGAVIGREFDRAMLAALSGKSAEQLTDALVQMEDSELVFRRGVLPDEVYSFKHALVQDAAYESILMSKRQAIHGDLAVLLERNEQYAALHPGVLAQHFDRAGQNERAMRWYLRAGHRANQRLAHNDALHYFQRGLDLLPGEPVAAVFDESRYELNTEIGFTRIALMGTKSEETLKNFLNAYALARTAPDVGLRFRAIFGLLHVLNWSGRATEAKSYFKELEAILEQSDTRVHRLFVYSLKAEEAMFKGRFREALGLFERTVEVYDSDQDSGIVYRYGYDPGTMSIGNLAYTQWDTGLLDQSLRNANRSLEICRRIARPATYAQALAWAVCDLSYFMWMPERILAHAGECEAFFGNHANVQRHDLAERKALSFFHIGWALVQVSEIPAGLARMEQEFAQIKSVMGTGRFVARLTAQLAQAYGQAGQPERGLQLLSSSPDRKPGAVPSKFQEIYRIEGDLHLAKSSPDPDLAEKLYKQAIEYAVADGAITREIRAATSLAKLWQSQGKAKEAKSLLQPIYDQFTEGFEFPDLKNARSLLQSLGV